MEDRNPYAPPASSVADPTFIGPKPPKVVTGAIYLMWAWLIASLASAFLPTVVPVINRSLSVISMLILIVIPLGIPLLIGTWLTARIGAGRNWARILVSTVLAVSAGYLRDERATLFFLFQGKMSLTLLGSFELIKLLLSLITALLLYTPPANRWFAAKT